MNSVQDQTASFAGGSGTKKGTGAVKVDTDIDCDANREDNTPCVSSPVIWLNTSPDKFCSSGYSYVVVDDGKNILNSGAVPVFTQSCDSNYWWGQFTAPGSILGETYTLILTSNCTGHSVGRDSYRWCGKL